MTAIPSWTYSSTMKTRTTEALAAAFGLIGTFLLATNGPYAGWGFVAYFISNIGWIAFSWEGRHRYLFIQQIGFTVASVYGIWTWLVRPLVT
jgi:hypothetical protein